MDDRIQALKNFIKGKNRKISIAELKAFVDGFGRSIDVENLASILDVDRDGFVTSEDVRALIVAEKDRFFDRGFKTLDGDNDGRISVADLHSTLRRLGTEISIEECREAIVPYDGDGDGVIDYEEYVKMMTRGMRSWGFDI
ncbi:hypothetical protein M569_04806 [Genlisea aurea]|uniref:EF-hand domain-containing protein n=1 Tax=Genlisea aurea TaxID=192259 RepID=S8EBP0_9LAMI|nr:hypothetical protein M569_04806 [Genlisea aurea]